MKTFLISCLLIGEIMGLELTSSAFKHNEKIPRKYTCQGDNISPPLHWEGKLENVKSYVLLVDDPDAPNGTVDHWVLFNIPPTVNSIEEGRAPSGSIQGLNSSGANEYKGPCPPSGTHRYFFKLYALNDTLILPEEVTKADVERAIKPYIIDKTELVGKYSKIEL